MKSSSTPQIASPSSRSSTLATIKSANKIATSSSKQHSGWLNRKCRQLVLNRLGDLPHSGLNIIDCDGSHWLGKQQHSAAEVQVHDLRFWRMMATGGSVGAGEAYVAGLWDAEDLTAVIQVFARNRDALSKMEQGSARLYSLPLALLHRWNKNSLQGSRRNISAHYDLGNDFFASWLDQQMQYSSAWFITEEETLEQAQTNKLARIAESLQLGPNDHLLEIGTGWGGLAIYMAKHTGCRVTTTTISKRQFEFAQARVIDAGLEDQIELLFSDYRDLEGQYDKLVSIEMIEAVGANYLNTYMKKVGQLLKPDGLALIQAITIEDFRYLGALKRADFIQRYIFPGSFLPSLSAITSSMATSSEMALLDVHDMGESYARTLASWRQRFDQAWEQILSSNQFDESFRRRWHFYLCYCEGGFLERAISDVQLLFANPEYRRLKAPKPSSPHAS